MLDVEYLKQQIKTFVSVEDVFNKYAGPQKKYMGRYKCPFNNSEHRYNFAIKDNYWKCFSCSVGGDQISFVQKMFDLSPYEAMKQIAKDFELKTEFNAENDRELRAELERRIKQRNKDKLMSENLKQAQYIALNYITQKIKDYQKIIDLYSLKDENELEKYQNSAQPEKYISALSEIDKLEYLLDVIIEQPSNDDKYYLYPAITREELHERMIYYMRKLYTGEVKI